MKNSITKPNHAILPVASMSNVPWLGRFLALIAAMVCLFAATANADTTMTITNPITKIFAGAGVTGIYPGYTNVQVKITLTGDTNVVDLYVTGAPAGTAAGFVTNGLNPNSATNMVNFLQVTSTISVWLEVAVTNAAKGLYPLTLTASNEYNQTLVTSSTLLVMPVGMGAQIGSTDTNWSNGANWTTGSLPVNGDDVKIEYIGAAPQTNFNFNTSATLDSLTLLPKITPVVSTLAFAPNVTIAISGSNGFWAGWDANPNPLAKEGSLNVTVSGLSGSLIVTNPIATFSMYGTAIGGSTASRYDLSGLGNLYADVQRFGGGDGFLLYPAFTGTTPAQNGVYSLARTNFIRSTYVGDYSGLGTMTNSIMFMNNGGNNNGNFVSQVNLGITNVFYADSITAISHGSGSATSLLRFNPLFTSSNPVVATIPVAVFRGTNGGRMPFFGVGIDSGLASATARTRGSGADFSGGKVDMLVDTMWLGHNRTNFSGGNQDIGNLSFNNGIIDVNVLEAGYKQWTNDNKVQAQINVGGLSNAVAILNINTLLDLGHCDVPMIENVDSPTTFGKLAIFTNGLVRANTIINGIGSTADTVAINNGGVLIVTNTIGAPNNSLPVLSMQAFGTLTLNVVAGVTNAYVTNFTDAVGSKINIASLTGFSTNVASTNILIAYQTAGSHSVAIGTVPTGFNNVILFDNTANKTIELRIFPNAPQVLRWKGFVNNVWDHTTQNWQNTNTLAQVTFNDADSVIIQDGAGVPTSISVVDFVIPNSAGTGILVSNSASAFSFEDGGGQVGTCTMIKQGTANFTNNALSGVNVQFSGGTFLGSGSVGALTISTNASMAYSGSVSGAFVLNGGGKATLLSGGTINSTFLVQSNGVFTNSGTIQGGSLNVSTGGLFVNVSGGNLANIGSSATVSGTLVNSGIIGAENQANTLTINGTFKDSGILNSIYLTTLTFNSGATFLPGGDGIGTTEIHSALVGSGFPGRLTMLTGSTNVIKVDFSNPQTNTVIVAQFTDFGGNVAVKSFDGCTVLMTNVNPGAGSFANGQSFRVFTGPSGSDIGNEGLNTTNRYPIVVPIIPLANTKWDFTNLRDTSPNGFLNIVGFPTVGTNVTVAFMNNGSNIVAHLQWPSDYIGWKLQQQTNSLSVGLSTNWTVISGSTTTNELYITNDAAINTSFFRMTYP